MTPRGQAPVARGRRDVGIARGRPRRGAARPSARAEDGQCLAARGRQDLGIVRGRPRRGAARPSTRAEDGRGPVARGRRGRLVGAQPSTRAVAGRREEARHRTRASAGQRRGGARPSTRTGVGRCLVARRRHGVSRVRCSTVATERRSGMAEQGAMAAASAVRRRAVARVHACTRCAGPFLDIRVLDQQTTARRATRNRADGPSTTSHVTELTYFHIHTNTHYIGPSLVHFLLCTGGFSLSLSLFLSHRPRGPCHLARGSVSDTTSPPSVPSKGAAQGHHL
jgi:hypothetical protein